MGLATFDLDIDDLPDDLALTEGQDGAFVLLRIAGKPVGQAILSSKALASRAPLRRTLMMAANSSFWEAFLNQQLSNPVRTPALPAKPSCTVVICTRDRTDDLARCIEGLHELENSPSVLVVDNAPSSDSTRDLVRSFPRVQYLREERPGLDVARNTAIRAVTSEVIAFIDDDAVPDRMWLEALLRNFTDPTILAVGGLTLALELDAPAQMAFQRVGGFSRGYTARVLDGLSTNPFDAWQSAAGVNLAIRRSAVEIIGYFDEALDAGTLSQAGGDTDFCRRILTAGYKIAYDPQALNWHRHRRSMEELQRQIYGYECAFLAIMTKALIFEKNPKAIARTLSWLRHQIPFVLRSCFDKHDRQAMPFNVAWTQLRGALVGPTRYLRARRAALRQGAAA